MKRVLILLILVLSTITVYSQDDYSGADRISFGIYQDGKLMVGGDSDYGNDNPTLDVILTVNLGGKQFSTYYFSIQPFYEHANLYGGYLRRYGVNGLWNFNKLIIPKLEINTGVGIGMIHRPTGGTGSYQAIGELRYPIYKRLKGGVRYELVRRTDNDVNAFKNNLSFGLVYLVN